MSLGPKSRQEIFLAKQQSISDVPELSFPELIFDLPLYQSRRFDDAQRLKRLFKKGSIKIDGHCNRCDASSVFHTDAGPDYDNIEQYNGVQGIWLTCQRDHTHRICIIVHVDCASHMTRTGSSFPKTHVAGVIEKIGQMPSHADIANGGLKEFTRILNQVDRKEFIRANGLAAHGVNIGSFVYLRRLFERLVWRAKDRMSKPVPDDEFSRLPMQEKISALGDVLPRFMVENKKIYAVLSKGIHELDEDQCGRYYELMRSSVLLILEQEKELKERMEREQDLAKLIKDID